jgi:preprotein translocase subunit YajC
VDGDDHDEEIGKGDTVVVAGGVVIVIKARKDGDAAVKFLRLTSLETGRGRRRRGRGDGDSAVPWHATTLV